ncbi:MAG: diacylglycerol kinase [Desulfovibrionales bacterium]|nr:diacylglycerol kinase [Desulfovibrionales bacterium]
MSVRDAFTTGIAHFFQASGHSAQGILTTFKTEIAFKQELLLLPVILIAAWIFFGFAPALMLTGMWLIVCAFELCNSAIENIADLVMPEKNAYIKRAKDAGSAAVGVAIAANILCWLYFIFL